MGEPVDGYMTLGEAVDHLTRRGFTASFRLGRNGLEVVETGQTLQPADMVIREFHRFEGISDPDDMAIVYAIEAANGVRGTVADAFGVYSDPALSAALAGVRFAID